MSAALPGIAPARQPYPGGSDRHVPIVPHVLIIGDRTSYYKPPTLIRAATIYDTPTTVRLQLPATAKGGPRQETQVQHKVWAIPDGVAWTEVEAAVAAFGQRLAELADVLRDLGAYKRHLAKWDGATTAPNPLCPAVARVADPDKKGPTTWWLSAWYVPRIEHQAIARHTPKMLSEHGTGGYFFSQDDCFVLADDAAWQRVEAAHTAAETAARAVEQLLERLGTYGQALDGRHSRPVDVAERALATAEQALAAGDVDIAEQLLDQAEAQIAEEPIRRAPPLRLSTSGATEIEIARLRRDGGTQPRAEIDRDHVARLEEALAAGETLPPVVVYYDGEAHWLADGFHRVEASTRRQLASIAADVRQGTRRDAVLFSTGANRAHGLPRSREDLRRQIETLLRDEEWGKWSDREIARQVGCSHATVGTVRKALEATGQIVQLETRKGADGKARALPSASKAPPAQEVRQPATSAETPAPADALDIPPTLLPVAAALHKGDTKLAYAAAREVHHAHHLQALAAIDARVEGRPLEQALAFLRVAADDVIGIRTTAGPRKVIALRRSHPLALTLAVQGTEECPEFREGLYAVTHIPTGLALAGQKIAGRERADVLFEALARLDWSQATSPATAGLGAALSEQVIKIFGLSPASAPAQAPPVSDYLGADELAAMAAQARAELAARAAAVGYTLTWRPDGGVRFVQTATGAPFGGARDLAETAARVASLEAAAATQAAPPAQEAPAAPAAPEDADEGWISVEDEDGPAVMVRGAGLSPVVADAVAQVAEGLRLIALGDAHAVDTELLRDMASLVEREPGQRRGTLRTVLRLVADEADELARQLLPALTAPRSDAVPSVPAERWPHVGHEELDALSEELLAAEISLSPPGAGEVAHWQDLLDAHAAELTDDQYERLAHRIGDLRARVGAGVAS